MFRVSRRATVLVAFALLAGACGGGKEVGGGLKADGTSGGGEGAIGQATTTTTPPTTIPVTTTAAAKPTATTAEIPPCQIVYINNDDKGRYFEPASDAQQNEINCTAGRYIRFINRDDDSRRAFHTLHSDPSNPELTSPQIPFNGKWDAKVTRRGTFTLKDDQRPYAEIIVKVV
jgi:hypothetical protein